MSSIIARPRKDRDKTVVTLLQIARATMRLLKASPSGDFEMISFDNDSPPRGDVRHKSTQDWFAKIRFCGERAVADGLDYFWIDTCCIDRSDAKKLQLAINLMFRYYQRATKCYVYLSDVHVSEETVDVQAFRITWENAFRRSRWFTRGWTLQELLAPATIEFFSANNKQLGSKISLEQLICDITKLPIEVLRGQQSFSAFSFEERLNWVAQRTTTYAEDKIYCLQGIFGIFLSVNYGEGEAYALGRLKAEIHRQQAFVEEKDALVLEAFSRNMPEKQKDNDVAMQALGQADVALAEIRETRDSRRLQDIDGEVDQLNERVTTLASGLWDILLPIFILLPILSLCALFIPTRMIPEKKTILEPIEKTRQAKEEVLQLNRSAIVTLESQLDDAQNAIDALQNASGPTSLDAQSSAKSQQAQLIQKKKALDEEVHKIKIELCRRNRVCNEIQTEVNSIEDFQQEATGLTQTQLCLKICKQAQETKDKLEDDQVDADEKSSCPGCVIL